MSDDKQKHRQPPRTGSVNAVNPELAEWLQQFWTRDEPPQRLEVFQATGQNKATRGDMIFHIDFKATEKYDIERCVRISNEIMAAVQNDTNVKERKSTFQIAVTDLSRQSVPLVRLLGPIHQTHTAISHPDGSFDEDGPDDENLSGKSLNLIHLRDGYKQLQFEQVRNDRTIGDLLLLQRNIIHQQQTFVSSLMQAQRDLHEQYQAAEDRKDDRMVRRAMTELKVAGIKEAMRTTRTLLPTLFGSGAAVTEPGTEVSTATPSQGSTQRNYGQSAERTAVDNFLHDCEETKITEKLFGEWEKVDGSWKPIKGKPGIFSPEQFAILVAVRQGQTGPETLDALLPASGDPRAVTPDQISRAQLVMPESVGLAIAQIFFLRQQKQTSSSSEDAS